MRSEDRDVISWNREHLLLDLPQPMAPASVRFCPPVRMFGPQGQLAPTPLPLRRGGYMTRRPGPARTGSTSRSPAASIRPPPVSACRLSRLGHDPDVGFRRLPATWV